ncbi:hypothetical protein A3K34_00955 [candidate division WWE3 bacterium RIFOXYC1_FULL_40_10]|uniref:Oligoendopeptidase F n=1 Tax=candidate division WWE3 bacterium RIFOXYA2_FULL_46_9 TaxID=1802636 RepID=A0A1F4W1Z1_UNCKA|nr:MAG: hypothetical protein A3K58_00955 [candidate division WWE3 bacterium RIFOXYB1_FULL_40_22]OGC61442.1 MAG: hypothetical protein A3K37_00955 [candidate division WWE3 bacterium RIFOXYA1_FULL_40_11]OGC63375.1 MAG: hypothetical protein A2264_01430 [candidate division WWE3 bacterium RIFOXYA2_FULL_46_9]OGC64443.1 MAG: hypothetical protein A2326_00230 [candidate division WWE3 bacterium RIFOXYB2_FULL_41_6]OGC65825.1 MAG: hypothetical protein A3K34_00955 [candidate division WWE3 bacterium RIFOXYC1_
MTTNWDLSNLLVSDLDETIKANHAFINKWRNREDFLKDPEVLKQALDEYEQLEKLYGTTGKTGYYYSLRLCLEQNNPEIKAKYNQLEEKSINISNAIMFFEHKLARISIGEQKKFLGSQTLKPYHHYLEQLFALSKYLLSEPEEKIINSLSPMAYSKWTDMTEEFLAKEQLTIIDEKGNNVVKTLPEALKAFESSTKKVRDTAAQETNNVFKKHLDTAVAELNAILQYKKTIDELKKIERPDLARLISDDIEANVIDALLQAVTEKYDVAQRFYMLKAKVLGVEKLEYHERYVKMGNLAKKYTYEESVGLIRKVFGNLDNEFLDIFNDYIINSRIDVYPKKGKTGGAFCTHSIPTLPGYILTNFTGSIEDVTTLAHEMGHAIHGDLSAKVQNALNCGHSLATAEVASTFMEDFVYKEIEKSIPENNKLYMKMEKLGASIATIFRQVACYKFEQELHSEFRKTAYLPGDQIGKIFQKHMKSYMGDYVKQSEGSENWWVYWSHIRNYFYVYSYASGLLISKAMQNLYQENPAFISKLKEFLRAGDSHSPVEIFGKLGLDITKPTFWKAGISEIEKELRESEKLFAKIDTK